MSEQSESAIVRSIKLASQMLVAAVAPFVGVYWLYSYSWQDYSSAGWVDPSTGPMLGAFGVAITLMTMVAAWNHRKITEGEPRD